MFGAAINGALEEEEVAVSHSLIWLDGERKAVVFLIQKE